MFLLFESIQIIYIAVAMVNIYEFTHKFIHNISHTKILNPGPIIQVTFDKPTVFPPQCRGLLANRVVSQSNEKILVYTL